VCILRFPTASEVKSAAFYFQQDIELLFRACSGSFFLQAFIFNKFSASFSGSFCPILKGRPFIFNHFSGSFLQN